MRTALFLSFMSLLSFNAFASKTVECKLRLGGNTVKCRVGIFCDNKVLRESSLDFFEELEDGQIKNGSVAIEKVIVDPGGSHQKDYNVFLFQGDDRAMKLKEQKDVDLIQVPTKSAIRYNISSSGNTLNIVFKGSEQSSYRFNISGAFREWLNGWVQIRMPGNDDFEERINPVLVSCRQVNTDSIRQSELEKQEIERHRKSRGQAPQSSAQ